MIQPIDEKRARYQVVKLMIEGKFKEAESLLLDYMSVPIIGKPYSDFYELLLKAVRTPEPIESDDKQPDVSQESLGSLNTPALTKTIGTERLKFVSGLGVKA